VATENTDSQNWYYRDFARTSPVQGPFTLAELAQRVQTGEVAYDSLVRCGDGEWLQADRITELIIALRQRRVRESEPSVAQIAAEVRADRRRLNWGTLFVAAVCFGLIGGLLIVVGVSDYRFALLALLGQIVSGVASVTLLCAIIRWAIDPLFAQLVDTNDQLTQIARLLKEAGAKRE
jgi:GYF domain 2